MSELEVEYHYFCSQTTGVSATCKPEYNKLETKSWIKESSSPCKPECNKLGTKSWIKELNYMWFSELSIIMDM